MTFPGNLAAQTTHERLYVLALLKFGAHRHLREWIGSADAKGKAPATLVLFANYDPEAKVALQFALMDRGFLTGPEFLLDAIAPVLASLRAPNTIAAVFQMPGLVDVAVMPLPALSEPAPTPSAQRPSN